MENNETKTIEKSTNENEKREKYRTKIDEKLHVFWNFDFRGVLAGLWEAKMPGIISDVDFLERSVEWRRPIAKLDSSELQLEYRKIPYAGHP